nr:MAG TPA: hypothetical protein [Caudoviricetes sp.]
MISPPQKVSCKNGLSVLGSSKKIKHISQNEVKKLILIVS